MAIEGISNLDLTPSDNYADLQLWLRKNFEILQSFFVSYKYTEITVASYDIQTTEILRGHNLFGVTNTGTVDITLPPDIDPTFIIVIRDETGGAATINLSVR